MHLVYKIYPTYTVHVFSHWGDFMTMRVYLKDRLKKYNFILIQYYNVYPSLNIIKCYFTLKYLGIMFI